MICETQGERHGNVESIQNPSTVTNPTMDPFCILPLTLPWHTTCVPQTHYTPVHLVESVENYGLCMRRYLACSSYASVMYREVAITRALRYDASTRD